MASYLVSGGSRQPNVATNSLGEFPPLSGTSTQRKLDLQSCHRKNFRTSQRSKGSGFIGCFEGVAERDATLNPGADSSSKSDTGVSGQWLHTGPWRPVFSRDLTYAKA